MYTLLVRPSLRLHFRFEPVPRGGGEFATLVERERNDRAGWLEILRLPLPQVFISTGVMGAPLVVAGAAALSGDVWWALLGALGYWPSACGLVWAADSLRFLHRGHAWAAMLDGPSGRRHMQLLGGLGAALATAFGYVTFYHLI